MSLIQRRRNYNRRALGYGGMMTAARYAYNNRQALQSAFMARRRSYTGTMTKKRMTTGVGVTSQYDKKLIYRKKRMPYRKKRAWKKFKNKVTAVSTKSLGSNTVVRNNLVQFDIQLIPANSSVQGVHQIALYPMQYASVDYLNDLSSIYNGDTRVTRTSKIIFMSGILDLTMRVQSLKAALDSGNPSLSAEIDVYEISMSGATGISGEATDLLDAFTKGQTDTGTIPGSTNALATTSRGWSPWDTPSALSQHRIKIWKKTKYFLSAEQTATYQMRDPKTHYFTGDQLPTGISVNKPGMTKFLLIVWKPIPGYNYVAAPNNDIIRLNVGITRKYLYKINEDDTDYDVYGN